MIKRGVPPLVPSRLQLNLPIKGMKKWNRKGVTLITITVVR